MSHALRLERAPARDGAAPGVDVAIPGSSGAREGAAGCAAGEPDVRGAGAGDPAGALRLEIPLRTGRGLNSREHWRARARRVKAERESVAWALIAQKPARPALPCTVTLTRIAPSSGLDDDNLAGSLKAIRDAVAEWLGVDDRDPRVTWRCAQRRAKGWAVEVHIA